MWVLFCKRTEDPKLSFIEGELEKRGIKSRRNGESFHAPILEVPEGQLDVAWNLLGEDVFGDGRRFDDIEDDDFVFGDVGIIMLRKVCPKRARKLRRRGTYVWWHIELESYVWEMKR